jgi:hypothetical protein
MNRRYIVPFLIVALGSSGLSNAAMSPKRLMQCAWSSTKYNCSEDEKKVARKWFIGVPVTIAVAILAAIGIKATSDAVKEAQQETGKLEERKSMLMQEQADLRAKRQAIIDQIAQRTAANPNDPEIALLTIRLQPIDNRLPEIEQALSR